MLVKGFITQLSSEPSKPANDRPSESELLLQSISSFSSSFLSYFCNDWERTITITMKTNDPTCQRSPLPFPLCQHHKSLRTVALALSFLAGLVLGSQKSRILTACFLVTRCDQNVPGVTCWLCQVWPAIAILEHSWRYFWRYIWTRL